MALDADLIADRIADRALYSLASPAGHLPALRAFSQNMISERIASTGTVQVEKTGSGAPTLITNGTDYEVTGTDNTNVPITVNEYGVSYTITSPEQLKGHKFLSAVDTNVRFLGKSIWNLCATLLTTANFGDASTSPTAEAAFAAADRESMWGGLDGSDETHLVLSRLAMANGLPEDKNAFQLSEMGAFGFDGLHLASEWASAEANVYGFASNPAAMVVAHGLPARMPEVGQEMLSVQTLQIPGLELEIEQSVWVNTGSKALWVGFALCFGVGVGDADALRLMKSV